jgi:hypothetical protein
MGVVKSYYGWPAAAGMLPRSILDDDARCSGAVDYRALAAEVVSQEA